MNKEPIYHDVEDCLPINHPLANETLDCKRCNQMLHCCTNEFMQPWFETEEGNYCFMCFAIRYVFHEDKEQLIREILK